MRYAIVDGKTVEATKGATGICQLCESPVRAKCGDIRVHHWAHDSRQHCDPWWENETEWHREWKNHFRPDWQEVRRTAHDGEVHIADVRTPAGWVLEFQHSKIDPEERKARERFYGSLIWVVDGRRRKRDETHFLRELSDPVSRHLSSVAIVPSGKCALLQEWMGSPVHVFFDFGGGSDLRWLWPGSDETRAFVWPIPRAQFTRSLARVDRYGPSKFEELAQQMKSLVARLSAPEPPPPHPLDPQPPPPRAPFVRRATRNRFRF
jgi:hypothetical protein